MRALSLCVVNVRPHFSPLLPLTRAQATRHLTRAQAASVRRALDNFNLLATGHGFNVNRVLSLEGQLDEVLTEAVGEQHIQLLAMALPQVRGGSW